MDSPRISQLFSLNVAIAVLSLGWLCLRLRKVLRTPVDDLVKILGLEVPVPPLASLLEISATSTTVHWKSPDQRNGALKFAIRINGVTVGEVSNQESAVTISGLQPSRCYIIRVVAINQALFSASSEAIRLQTTEGENEDATHTSKRKRLDGVFAEAGAMASLPSPNVAPSKAFSEYLLPSTATAVTRDQSNINGHTRRSHATRRGSYVVSSHHHKSLGDHGDNDIIRELTTRLDSLRVALQNQQAQDEDEEADFQRTQLNLAEQRDDLRKQLKERDDQNKDINKSVKSLEHANSAAQIRKSQHEKAFNDKLRARERMREDMARWVSETQDFDIDCDTLLERQRQLVDETDTKVDAIRAEQRPDIEILALIEEQIQEKGREMQELDKERKQLEDASDEVDNVDRSRAIALADLEWTEKIAHLQAQLHEANTVLSQTRYAFQQAQQQLDVLSSGRRPSIPNGLAHQILSDYEHLLNDVPSAPHAMHATANFELTEQRTSQVSIHNRHATSSTNSLRTSSPFVNHVAHIPLPGRYQSQATDLDLEALTGGAMTSPSAGALLPSNLLGDDLGDDTEEMVKPRLRGESQGHSNSRPASSLSRPLSMNVGRSSGQTSLDVDSLSGLGTLPGLGDQGGSYTPTSPPASYGSASPSVVSSPRGSIANLHKNSDPNIDMDRRSVRSASGSSRILPSTRRLELFSRQRGKTTPDEGPVLGSLKPNQSQSMPRESGNGLSGPAVRNLPRPTGGLFGVLGRRSAGSDASVNTAAFTSRGSRPGSTYSAENALPHPSANSPRFGWGISKESLERRKSTRVNPWSPLAAHQQARPLGSTSSLIGVIGGVAEDEDELPGSSEAQAPVHIGTKTSRDKNKTAQLNPNARDFTSILGFGKKGDKSEKAASRSKRREGTPLDGSADGAMEHPSPADFRKSKDVQPGSGTASSEDLTEGLESVVVEAQENAQLNPSGKGSLIRRITGKGSSGKFALPGQNLFSRKIAPSASEEVDDDSASSKLGRSVESITNASTLAAPPDKRGSAFSLSSLKRRSRKANEAPSISEASMASETGDEEDGLAEDGSYV